jgi:hypothetical protein
VGQGEPKPLGGLLRAARGGSILDSLGLARTTLAPSFHNVCWCVGSSGECMVVGEGVWCCASKVATPPASRAAAPLCALDAKSVLCAFLCVLPHLRRISELPFRKRTYPPQEARLGHGEWQVVDPRACR